MQTLLHSRNCKYFCQGFYFHHDSENQAGFYRQMFSVLTSLKKFPPFCIFPMRTNTFWHKKQFRATHVVLKNFETWSKIPSINSEGHPVQRNACANMQLYSINTLYLLAVFQSYQQFMREFYQTLIIFQSKNKLKKYIIFCLFLVLRHYFHDNIIFSHYLNAKKQP